MHRDPVEGLHLLPRPRTIERTDAELAFEGPLACEGEALAAGGLRLLHGALERRRPRAGGGEPLRLVVATERSLPRQGYRLAIDRDAVRLTAADRAGQVHGCATLAQLLAGAPADARGTRLPGLQIEDAPALARRGVMLDVSRDRIPTMATFERLVELFAGWKLNELQLYTEHTFAYAGHEDVWRGLDPLTPDEVRQLDALCRTFAIELVPNQQCFGHMHRWLTLPRYRPLAECPDGLVHPFSPDAEPFSLCPGDPRSLDLVEDLLDQLLPCFTSGELHVGLDETFDLGQGRSRAAVEARGVGEVHMDFLCALHERVAARGKRLWFWADIALHHPGSLDRLPADVVACSWGYEAGHDFEAELGHLAEHGIAHVACPGTTSWKSFVGRPANMAANVDGAASAALRHGSLGLLMTDWGDQGHLQPPPVSYPAWAAAAARAWRPGDGPPGLAELAPAVDRDAFGSAGLTRALWELGRAGERAGHVPNATVPFQLLLRRDPFPPAATPAPTAAALARTLAELEAVPLPPLDDDEPGGTGRRPPDEATLARAELRWAADAARLGCRLGLARLATPELPPEGLPAGVRGPLAEELTALVAEHRQLWPLRSRRGGLASSASWLETLLALLK